MLILSCYSKQSTRRAKTGGRHSASECIIIPRSLHWPSLHRKKKLKRKKNDFLKEGALSLEWSREAQTWKKTTVMKAHMCCALSLLDTILRSFCKWSQLLFPTALWGRCCYSPPDVRTHAYAVQGLAHRKTAGEAKLGFESWTSGPWTSNHSSMQARQ